jgi:hypothetical protein
MREIPTPSQLIDAKNGSSYSALAGWGIEEVPASTSLMFRELRLNRDLRRV